MAKQIGIRWDSAEGGDYGASVAALREYVPMPQIDASIRVKGVMPEEAVRRIAQLSLEYGLDVNVTITATWDDEAMSQLRLFGPPGAQGRLEDLERNDEDEQVDANPNWEELPPEPSAI